MKNVLKHHIEKMIENLPEWVTEDDLIQIIINKELFAFSPPGSREVKVKKVRCIKCGECCMDIGNDVTPFGSDDENKCTMLKKEGGKWICVAGGKTPVCCLGDPIDPDIKCSIRYF